MTLNNDAPVNTHSTVGVSASMNAARVLAIGAVGALGKFSTMAGLVSESTNGHPSPIFSFSADTSPTSPEPDTAPGQPYQAIFLSNFEQTLKEITLPSSEPLGGVLGPLRRGKGWANLRLLLVCEDEMLSP